MILALQYKSNSLLVIFLISLSVFIYGMYERKQIDRFKKAARQLECEDDEVRFNAKVKKVAKAKVTDKPTPVAK